MLPSCKQAAEQLSEQIDQPMSGLRWLKLKIHLLICKYCRRYGKQIAISSKSINLVVTDKPVDRELKERLLEHYRSCHLHDKRE